MIEVLDNIIIFRLGPIGINATLFYSWIVMAVLVMGSWLITRSLKTTIEVGKFQTLLEMIVSTSSTIGLTLRTL